MKFDKMDFIKYPFIAVFVLMPLCNGQWQRQTDGKNLARVARREAHYHTKRNMMTATTGNVYPDGRKQSRGTRENGKIVGQSMKVNYKPPGHLTPLKEDDIDNDEVVSVAIGPPPMRPMYEKRGWKPRAKNHSFTPRSTSSTDVVTSTSPQGAVNLVKDVLTFVAKEFLSHQVNDDFVFGQFIGQSMKNITGEHKLKLQHEILDLVIRYQKLSQSKENLRTSNANLMADDATLSSTTTETHIRLTRNDTDETWPDFANLANVVV